MSAFDKMDKEAKKRLRQQGIIKPRNRRTHANVVWYVNNSPRERIATNVPIGLAYALKGKNSKLNKYKSGIIKIELL